MLVSFLLIVIWILLTLKTTRPDGILVDYVHPYRKMLLYIMPTKAESVVLFDEAVPADNLLEYIQTTRERFKADMNHVLLAALGAAFVENPELNRFVMGRRLYQLDGVWLTFSMKRRKGDKRSKVAAVKLEMFGDETFEQLSERINQEVERERSDAVTYADRELGAFSQVPRPLLRLCVTLFKAADYFNLLPGTFIEKDGLYTSAFVANLGSLGMKAGYHHLFEWGNCPVFIMAGEVEERAVVEDGEVRVRKMLPIRVTYDERIDDGLTARGALDSIKRVLLNPATELGCIADDGSDKRVMGEQR